MKLVLTFYSFTFFSAISYSQLTTISGQIKNSDNKYIDGINVTVKNKNNIIIKYATTDSKGKYSIVLNNFNTLDSLILEVLTLEYEKATRLISSKISIYDFTLKEKYIYLDSVKVKTIAPIKAIGDTLRYNVNAFAKEEDRSIGDVIKRIPGMSVEENGQISFNGKPISNLYIQGDDLMDGRYGLATKAISKETIKSIDVIQNFQPIRVLKDRLLTDDIAVNLILKDENSLKLNGQLDIGFGLPKLYDASATLMLFNKKVKFLNSLKVNNYGTDYTNEFKAYGATNFLTKKDNNRYKEFLSSAVISNPDIPKQQFYFNNSSVVNINSIYNTKDSLQIKLNLQVYNDKNSFEFKNNLDNYLNNDTIKFQQSQLLLSKIFNNNVGITLLSNKHNNYLQNKTTVSFNTNVDNSKLTFNNSTFSQQLNSKFHDISNDFTWIPNLKGKDIVTVKSYFNYYNSPQTLLVNKGINEAVLNNNLPYKSANQNIDIPTFFNNISVNYLVGKKAFITQQYEIGNITEVQQLFSKITIEQLNGSKNDYTGDAGNALKWVRNKFFVSPTYSINNKNWRLNLSIPIINQSILYKQKEYLLNKKDNILLVNPTLNAQIYLNAEDYFTVNYAFKNNFGNISGVYRGLILTDYRTLQANNTELQETYNNGSGIVYYFRRAMQMFFLNIGVKYNNIKANTLTTTILQNNTQQTTLIPFNNNQSSISANAEISKYFFKAKTKLNLRTFWSRSYYNQLINNQTLNFSNTATNIIIELDGKLNDYFVYNYSGSTIITTAQQRNSANSNKISGSFNRYDNRLMLGYSSKKVLLNLKFSHIYALQAENKPINYFFNDAVLMFKNKKIKTDFTCELNNILNVKSYEIFSITSNQFSQDVYRLRGRTLLLKATFNL